MGIGGKRGGISENDRKWVSGQNGQFGRKWDRETINFTGVERQN